MFRDVMFGVMAVGGLAVFWLFMWIFIKDFETTRERTRQAVARREQVRLSKSPNPEESDNA